MEMKCLSIVFVLVFVGDGVGELIWVKWYSWGRDQIFMEYF
jgi:hypothetical protein